MVTTSNESSSKPVTAAQFSFVMVAVGAILLLNLVMVIAALVIGLGIKSDVDELMTETEAIRSILETLGGGGGGTGGSLPENP